MIYTFTLQYARLITVIANSGKVTEALFTLQYARLITLYDTPAFLPAPTFTLQYARLITARGGRMEKPNF